MPKIKISGATPSHPIPPPPVCTANKYCMLMRTARMNPRNFARATQAPRELLFHHGVWIDFGRVPSAFRLESGEAFRGV